MTKAEELLKGFVEYIDQPRASDKVDIVRLLKETLSYLKRKEKLEIGSEWMCGVECIGYYVPHVNGQKVIVNSFTTSKVKQQIVGVTTTDQGKDEIPLGEFLACFVPKED